MIEVRRHRLENGCRVLIRPTPGKPILSMLAMVQWGGRDNAPESAGLSHLMARLLPKGSARRSAYEIVEALESVGGDINDFCTSDDLGLETQTVDTDWRVALDTLTECLFEPSFPPDEVDKERALVCAGIRQAEDDKFSYTYKHLCKVLDRGHPYALAAQGEVETVEKIERDAIVALHRAVVHPGRILLVVVGNVPEDEFLKRLEDTWPVSPASPVSRVGVDTQAGAGRGERVDLARDVEQGFVVIGYPAPPVGHADTTALRLACGVLGEGMSARLFSRLRDRDHLAYMVGSRLAARELGSRLIAYIGTSPSTVDAALEGLARETQALKTELPTAEELDRAREYVLGKYLISRQTNAALAHTMATPEAVGLGWQWAEEFPERIRAVTPEQVVEAADTYLKSPAVAVLKPRAC